MMIDRHEALIYSMVTMAAADSIMTQSEMDLIGRVVTHLPVFRDFDLSRLSTLADHCIERLDSENGIDDILDIIRENLPPSLYETAYALAVEVAAADLEASDEELNLLQMMRQAWELDRLICAGIERGVRARYTVR